MIILPRLSLVLIGIMAVSSLLAGGLRAESVPGTLTYINGEVTVTTASGLAKKAMINMLIPPGSTIVTGINSSAGLKLMPGATTVLGQNTSLKISTLDYVKKDSGEMKRAILLRLQQGTIYSTLAKNDGKSDFRVQTPRGVAAARGTDWSVTVNGLTVIVSVLDGTINLTLPNGDILKVDDLRSAVTGLGQPSFSIIALTDEQKEEIINAINGAGFSLSLLMTNSIPVYLDRGTNVLNPANLSSLPTQSPNQ